ncbi:13056_t:CDS:2, partial [Acaulospora colombiana]
PGFSLGLVTNALSTLPSNFNSAMNGINNASNTKNAVNKPSSVNQSPAQPILAPSNNSPASQKVQSNASAATNNGSTRTTNGDVNSNGTNKGKKAPGPPINSSEVQELVQSRIAALEGEKVQGGEEDRRSAPYEIRGTGAAPVLELGNQLNAFQYQDFRRQEREHTKERQKNKKEADACEALVPLLELLLIRSQAKTALTNVQKLKSKTDAVVRDMQKQNKDLRVSPINAGYLSLTDSFRKRISGLRTRYIKLKF